MSITIENYSDKAIIVKGKTEYFKDKFEELKGTWNENLKGWFFSKNKEEKVKELIKKIENREIKPKTTEDKKFVSHSEYLSLVMRIEKLETLIGLKEKFGDKIFHVFRNGEEPKIEFEEENDREDKKDDIEEKPKRLLRK
jgi:hypothetical protein